MSNFNTIEKALLDGLKITFVRQGIQLTRENYSEYVNIALKQIIFFGQYGNFTNCNNAREKIMKYSKNDFIRFVISEYMKQGGTFEIDDENLYIERKKLLETIDAYSNEILPRKISEKYFINDIVIEDIIENFIDNVKLFKPSNKCRKAVFNNEQIKVSYSEYKVAGMQAVSSVGKVRTNQEDSYYIGVHPKNNNFKILIVCDGVGGEMNGDIASNLATREMIEWFESLPEKEYYSDDSNLATSVSNKLIEIDSKIKSIYGSPATTICFSIIKNNHIFIGNIGDSMGYVFSNGRLIYTTKKDGLVYIDEDIRSMKLVGNNFTSLDRFVPYNNTVTLALGRFNANEYGHLIISETDLKEKYAIIPLKENRKYQLILCSDGISDCIGVDQIIETLRKSNKNSVAKNLVDLALTNVSSFQEELKICEINAGIAGKYNFEEILKILEEHKICHDYSKKIEAGKDNTTAIYSGVIRKR